MRIFENTVLKRLFRRIRQEIREFWRNLLNEKLHNFHFLLDVIMARSQRVGWTVHVARTGKKMHAYVYVATLKLREQPVDGWVILI